MLVFVEGGKVVYPEKKPSEQGEKQQQTQPTYEIGPESSPGHIGERQAGAATTAPSLLPCKKSIPFQ